MPLDVLSGGAQLVSRFRAYPKTTLAAFEKESKQARECIIDLNSFRIVADHLCNAFQQAGGFLKQRISAFDGGIDGALLYFRCPDGRPDKTCPSARPWFSLARQQLPR
jgi:hypothetical protein